jgi:hypothetical protein
MVKLQGKSTTNAPINFDGNFTRRKYQLPPIITSMATLHDENTSCHRLSQVLLPADTSFYFFSPR